LGPMTTSMTMSATTRRFHITRYHIFATFFIVVGLLMFLRVPGAFGADEISKMSFGSGRDAPVWEASTRNVLLVVAALFVAGGVISLVNRWPRLSFVALLVNGILIFPAVLIGAAVGKQTNMLTMLAESLRLATPIVIGATAGIWAERSGVVNIAIEGMMLAGACFGFTAFFYLEPAMPNATNLALFISVIVAMTCGALMALLHAWLSIRFKTDQIVSGTVINILAIGLTSFVRREWLLSTRAGRVTLPNIAIPGLVDIPIVGDVLFNNKPIFYMMFVMLIVTHVVLFYTALGLRMRAVGEHPEAANTVGINVIFTRYRNLAISGMIAGLGGAWFSLETVGGFDDVMTGGRGFIALAAMIFGKWTPAGAFGGGLLFGFADALGTRFQILNVPVPPQWLQMLPFITTMVVLAGLIGRAVPPAAVGKPYEKQ
ncbi:MAG: ABC transporter permease, partial [Anaerolineales bacterium]